MTDFPHTDWVPEWDNIWVYYITFIYWAWSTNTRLYLLVQDETVADQGCESLQPRSQPLRHHPHHPQPYGAERCTPGPLSCCGSLELVKKAAAGPVIQLVACVLLSVQTAWCETIAAGDGGGGFDGAEDKKYQLCACSSYSATHKT